jgi:hypothetical protein
MPDNSTALIQSTLDMLILKRYSSRPCMTGALPSASKQLAGGSSKVNPGSLFPRFADWSVTDC